MTSFIAVYKEIYIIFISKWYFYLKNEENYVQLCNVCKDGKRLWVWMNHDWCTVTVQIIGNISMSKIVTDHIDNWLN